MDLLKLATLCGLSLLPTVSPTICAPAVAPTGAIIVAANDQVHRASGSTEGATTAVDLARWSTLITEAARRFRVPAAWIRAVISAESAGLTMWNGQPIMSSAGAVGLMQLMPKTYEEMQNRYGLDPNLNDPRDNILAGTAYLREMFDRFGYPGCFAAYNAGPGRYGAYLKEGRPLPDETVRYLLDVMRRLAKHAPSASEMAK
jgi:soluble lytic murein transglycosylase-like protein